MTDTALSTSDPGTDWDAVWDEVGIMMPGREGFRRIAVDGDELIIELDAYDHGDAMANATAKARVRIRVEDGIVHLVELERLL